MIERCGEIGHRVAIRFDCTREPVESAEALTDVARCTVGRNLGDADEQVGVRVVARVREFDDRLTDDTVETLRGALRQPTPERIFQVKHALREGLSIDEVYELTGIDPWFLSQMSELLEAERAFAALDSVDKAALWRMKRMGFADKQLADLRVQDLPGQVPGRDAGPQHAPGLVQRLEDDAGVALAAQVVSAPQAAGTRAHDRHRLAVQRWHGRL